jgi:competence protein CoiA
MSTLPFVIRPDGTCIYAERFDETAWTTLKETYTIGSLTAPCCGAPAIPKTSPNFVQFFAHYANECATSPESVWHLSTKDLILRSLSNLGVCALLERPVSGIKGALKSDVYFEVGGRKLAIEVQHSYQTYARYLIRQEKYRACGIENYWLVYPPRFRAITLSIARLQIKRDYGGVFPRDRSVGSIPDLPIAIFDTETPPGRVWCPGGLTITLERWLQSLISDTFQYVDDLWWVAGELRPAPRADVSADL